MSAQAATRSAGPRLSHRLEFLLVRAARAVASALPEWLVVRMGGGVGLIVGTVLRVRRRDVDAHLALAFPDASGPWRRRIARRSYVHLGRELAVLFRMGRWTKGQIERRVRFVGFDEIREAADRGEGVVLLTAHLGNWEMAGAGIVAAGYPLDVVGKGMSNRLLERDLFETRQRLGMGVITMAEAPREVLRSLRCGGVTALLGDQNAHRNGVFVPFFGRLAATQRGTALFALRTRAPIFVGYAIRDPGWSSRYTLEATRLDHTPTGDVDHDVTTLLRAYHAHLEQAIRAAPDQYFWHHRRWKTRPSEEQASDR